MRTRVKICCIASVDEAELAAQAGADAIGLVSEMPSGPGVITDAEVRTIARSAPSALTTFLLTSRERGADIADQVLACGTTTVQVVRHIDPSQYPALIAGAPRVRRVQVIHVEGADALRLVDAYAPHVHAFLLDSGRPGAGELGGTGRAHDWSVSAEIVRRSRHPVFLAGGLRAENVGEAVAKVQPHGLDLCSGVRTDGRLDPAKLDAFMRSVRAADAARV